jgi:hypothetical protein
MTNICLCVIIRFVHDNTEKYLSMTNICLCCCGQTWLSRKGSFTVEWQKYVILSTLLIRNVNNWTRSVKLDIL